MEDKKSLASTEERAKVEGKASLLAAVDYYVSMQSDIFISASPGNMHNALVRVSSSILGRYVSSLRWWGNKPDNLLHPICGCSEICEYRNSLNSLLL